MNKSSGFLVAAYLHALFGCTYNGALYTSYDQVDLGIRAAPETASPVKINFGRDHAVVSFVPRRENSESGEAVSLFATSDTESINLNRTLSDSQARVKAMAEAAQMAAESAKQAAADTTDTAKLGNVVAVSSSAGEMAKAAEGTDAAVTEVVKAADAAEVAAADQEVASAASMFSDETMIKAQGRFASGNAAKVLVIPKDKVVVVKGEDGIVADSFKLTSSPQARVRAAFASTTRYPTPEAADFGRLATNLSSCANVDNVYMAAAADLGACFDAFFNVVAGGKTAFRFDIARSQYLDYCNGASKDKVNKSLEQSINDNCP